MGAESFGMLTPNDDNIENILKMEFIKTIKLL